MSDHSESPEGSDSSNAEPAYLTLLRYAADNLSATDPLFVQALLNGNYECKECRQLYKRPSRIFAHYATKHFRRLEGIVSLHMLGVPLPGTINHLDGDVMDMDGTGNGQDSMVDPQLLEVFRNLLATSTDVATTRERLEVPIPDSDEPEDKPQEASVQYPTELTIESEVPHALDHSKTLFENPWEPFENGHEFKLGGWFLDASVGKTQINRFFNLGLGPQNLGDSFTSAYSFQKLLMEMNASGAGGYGNPMEQWQDGMVNFREGNVDHPVAFHYRDLKPTIKSFFSEPWFQDKLVFLPEKKIRADGLRMYTEMNTGDWWWNVQEQIDKSFGPGRFVIPIILGTDETHLTNFSGDKAVWPLYLSIGNLPSKYRNSPTALCWELVALLPVPPKHVSTSTKTLAVAREAFAQSVQATIAIILEPLKQLYTEGIQVPTVADSGSDSLVYRRGHPIVGAWLADYVEYLKLLNLRSKACPVCEVRESDLQHCTLTASHEGTAAPDRDPAMLNRAAFHYLQISKTGATPDPKLEAWFADRGAKPQLTAVWELPHACPRSIWKPDLLHTIYLGMLKHLTGWIIDFLTDFKRIEEFDWVWKNISKYPGLKTPNKAYREVKQWHGKEMRHAGRFLLAALDASLYNPATPTQRDEFNSILDCTRTLIDFHLICQQPLHDGESLKLMDAYLKEFHAAKDIFKRFRIGRQGVNAGKKAIQDYYKEIFGCVPDAKDPRLRKLTASQKQERDSRCDLARSEACNFNLPKLHLCGHFSSTVKLFGSLTIWSTEITETLHKQLKAYYGSGNKGGNFLEQIVIRWSQLRGFDMRRLNLQSLLIRKKSDDLREWERNVRKHLMYFNTSHEAREQAKQNRICDAALDIDPCLQSMAPYTPPDPHGGMKRSLIGFVRDGAVDRLDEFDNSTFRSRPTRTLGDLKSTYNLHNLQRDTVAYIQMLSAPYSIFSEASDDFLGELSTKCSLSVEVTNEDQFQFDEIEKKIARCTGPFTYRNEVRADAVYFLEDGAFAIPSNIQRHKDDGILSGAKVGILRCLFSLDLPPSFSIALRSLQNLEMWLYQRRKNPSECVTHALAYIELLDVENTGDHESSSKLARVSRRDAPRFKIVPITSIVRIAHLVPIPQQLWSHTRVIHRYILNNRVDLATWYQFY